MRKMFLRIMLLGAVSLGGGLLASCSTDDDPVGDKDKVDDKPKEEQVVTAYYFGENRKIQKIEDNTLTFSNFEFNEKGRVQSYEAKSKSGAVEKFELDYAEDGRSVSIGGFKFLLNDSGFMSHSDESYYKDFTYNKSGQLTKIQFSDGRFLGYAYDEQGDLAEENLGYSFAYTSSRVSKPIANVGGVVVPRLIIDNYQFSGLYGRASQHLPVVINGKDVKWELDAQGYPLSCEYADKNGEVYKCTYTWE